MNQRSFSQNLTSRMQSSLLILSIIWLAVAAFWLYWAMSREGQRLGFFVAIYLFLTMTCSLVSFVLALIDKRRAVRDRPRISERTLHVFSLAGGWPGACIGNWLFRHKTQKASYQAVFWLIVVVHLSAVLYCLYLTWWPAPSQKATASVAEITSVQRQSGLANSLPVGCFPPFPDHSC